MERPKSPELRGPLHIARCLGELAVMYAQEKVRNIKAALDDDPWPEDSPQDQVVRSGLWPETGDAA